MVGARRAYLVGACSGALLLTGCVAQPGGYAAPGYGTVPVAQGYGAPPGYYGYPGGPPPGYGDPGGGYPVGPDGLSYYDGVPVEVVEGETIPFVFVGEQGGWGYYDRGRRWHGAPPELRDRLERSHPGGRGLPPPEVVRERYERHEFDRRGPGGGPPGGGGERVFRGGPGQGGAFGGEPGRAFQPGGQVPGGGGVRPGFGGGPGLAREQGFPQGQQGGPGRPGFGGPQPAEGMRPGGQGRPPAPPPRPAPPPPRRAPCPPGQAHC